MRVHRASSRRWSERCTQQSGLGPEEEIAMQTLSPVLGRCLSALVLAVTLVLEPGCDASPPLAGSSSGQVASHVKRAAPARRLSIGLNFTGLTQADGVASIPDTLAAVGPKHIMELLNGRFTVYAKKDGTPLQAGSLDQFWTDAGATPPGATGDSRLLFDRFSKRWFASSQSVSPPGVGDDLLFAVSKTSDPTAGWTGFVIPFNGPVGNFVDFPTLGLNGDGVFLYSNGSVVVLPKSDLLAAVPTIAGATTLNSLDLLTPTGSKLQPIVSVDNSGMPEPILGSLDDPSTMFKRASIEGSVRSPVLNTSFEPITVMAFPGLGNEGAQQPDSTVTIQTNSITFNSSIVMEQGVMWGVQGVANQGRAALRWFAIDAATDAVLQEGLIADPDRDIYMGSIAVNQFTDVVIGFNISSATQFVSSHAVLGTTDGGTTTFGSPLLLKAGVAPYTIFGPVTRWGDYSATVIDPKNKRTFWTVQQWVSARDLWSTQITELGVVK
jgi:hypothetical protein